MVEHRKSGWLETVNGWEWRLWCLLLGWQQQCDAQTKQSTDHWRAHRLTCQEKDRQNYEKQQSSNQGKQ